MVEQRGRTHTMPDIKAIQAELRASKLDGWLFYDHHHRDPIAGRVLGLGENGLATRRWFYFIPSRGEPRKLVHRIEQGALDTVEGRKFVYAGWEELHRTLAKLLAGSSKIAMQYSPDNNIPYIGLVDAGTVELVRKLKKKVVSSADLVQKFEARWSPEQLESHFEAGRIIDRIRQAAFDRAAASVRDGKPLTEFQLQQWMLEQFEASGLTTAEPPIAAVQPNNGNPHYEPKPDTARPIRAGDLLLLDIWAKCNRPGSVYYDITWAGYLGARAPDTYARIFRIVKQARDRAIGFVQESVAKDRTIHGWEVDRVARETIRKAGYAKQFPHRTGHSIGQEVHGNGANMDGLETRDDRKIVARTCFSIEPGIYLPEFGIRSEVNIYVDEHEARVTGAIQEEILALLS
ncbi:MAG TPA: M24 family metallopeptidase [Candidatus Acidoferrales bacterium]|nr:M24 family metallopeptidase [Candidatus Acidoferrales bacterium]